MDNSKVLAFSNIIATLDISLLNDHAWPVIATELMKDATEDDKLSFWEDLEKFFLEKEKKDGH